MRCARCFIVSHVERADVLRRLGCSLLVAPLGLVGGVLVITELDGADGIEVVAALLKIKIRRFLNI